MSPFNAKAPVLDTYQAVVSAYSDFLIVAIHTILYERKIYPEISFIKTRTYNHPVRQNRHPKVCKWIQHAVSAVEVEMLKCAVSSTSLIINSPPPSSCPIERYVFSTAHFPIIAPSDIEIPFTTSCQPPDHNPTPASASVPPPSDLPEQFRATIARLSTSLPSSRLKPLPHNSTFTLAIELRDEGDNLPRDGTAGKVSKAAAAPIGREEDKQWIPAEPRWQHERQQTEKQKSPQPAPAPAPNPNVDLSSSQSKSKSDSDPNRNANPSSPSPSNPTTNSNPSKSKPLTGPSKRTTPPPPPFPYTTPIRALEAGAFKMEVWIEEAESGSGSLELEGDVGRAWSQGVEREERREGKGKGEEKGRQRGKEKAGRG